MPVVAGCGRSHVIINSWRPRSYHVIVIMTDFGFWILVIFSETSHIALWMEGGLHLWLCAEP